MQQATLVAILTTKCNNQCSNCVRILNPKDKASSSLEDLSTTKFKKIIHNLSRKFQIRQIIFTGGEPLLLHIENFLHFLLKYNIKRIHIQTNGTLICNTLDVFIRYENYFNFSFLISIYGTKEEEYQKYTKTNNWKKAWDGIEILKSKGFPYQIGILSDNIANLANLPKDHEYIAILPHRVKINKVLNWITQLSKILTLDNIYIEGLPPCFFPHYYTKFVSLRWPKRFIITKPNGSVAKAPPFDYMYKSKNCYKCMFNKLCPGIYREYSSLLESILFNHPLITYSRSPKHTPILQHTEKF